MKTHKRNRTRSTIAILVVDVVLIAVLLHTIPVAGQPGSEPAVAGACQYIGRPLLPDGSCDNSDPCDPSTTDTPGLWGDCELPKAPVQSPQPTIGGGK